MLAMGMDCDEGDSIPCAPTSTKLEFGVKFERVESSCVMVGVLTYNGLLIAIPLVEDGVSDEWDRMVSRARSGKVCGRRSGWDIPGI